MKDIFNILLKEGNTKLTIRYAKRIINDGQGMTLTGITPETREYELVEELLMYLPEECKNRLIERV